MIGVVIIGVCAVALVGILGGFLLHRIIGGYIEGSMSGMECALTVGLYLGFIFAVFTLKLALALGILVGGASLLSLLHLREKRTDRSFRNARVEQFRQAIAADPKNLAARTKLADALYAEGDLDSCIAELAEVVRRSPGSRPEAHRLSRLIVEREERQLPRVTCPSCGRQNPGDRTRCAYCESSLRMSAEFVKWLRSGGLRRVSITWAIAMAIIAGVIVGLSMLPVLTRIAVIALILIVAILVELLHISRS